MRRAAGSTTLRAIAALGVTVKGANEAVPRASAESIGRGLAGEILAAGKPLW